MTCLRTSGFDRVRKTNPISVAFQFPSATIVSKAAFQAAVNAGLYRELSAANDIGKPFRQVYLMFLSDGIAGDNFDILIHQVFQIGAGDSAQYAFVPIVLIDNARVGTFTPAGATGETTIRNSERMIDLLTTVTGLIGASSPPGILDIMKTNFSGEDPTNVSLGTNTFAMLGLGDIGNAQGIFIDFSGPVGVGLNALVCANV